MKRIIVVAGTEVHKNLRQAIGDKGYKVVEILKQPPIGLHGDQKVAAILSEFSRFTPPIGGENTTVIFAAGDRTWWSAAIEAFIAKTDGEEPYVLTPVHGGRYGKYSCMKGTERVFELP